MFSVLILNELSWRFSCFFFLSASLARADESFQPSSTDCQILLFIIRYKNIHIL